MVRKYDATSGNAPMTYLIPTLTTHYLSLLDIPYGGNRIMLFIHRRLRRCYITSVILLAGHMLLAHDHMELLFNDIYIESLAFLIYKVSLYLDKNSRSVGFTENS